MLQNVFDFDMKALDGTMVPLSRYRGRVLLIVNVASQCGLTNQYAGQEAWYRKFFPRGFEVLGFPCNQFLWEEPGNEKAIGEFCKTKYDVTFPMFAKVRVNGFFADNLFRFLKRRSRGVLWTTTIKWNFTKFLVN